MSSADFNDLLFEAEKLSNNIEGTSDLPKVERSLRQVLEASNELYTRVTQTGAQDIQANLLLGSKGIDLPQIAQKLEVISARKTFEPLDPIADNDISSFLKNEIENCILSCIEDAHKQTLTDIEEQLWNDINVDWRQEKSKILNSMIGPSGNFLDIRKHDVFQMPEDHSSITMLGFQEQVYVRPIMDYNKTIVKGATRPNLINLLSKAAEQFKDAKVTDMWDMVKSMLVLPPVPKNGNAIITRDSKAVKQALVTQAKSYLEQRYKTYMESVINDNLEQAKRGGIPGTYPLVKSFVSLRLSGGYLGLQDGMIDNHPLWPMVYYCLRSGDYAAALHCLKQAGMVFEDLVSILQEKLHKGDCKKLESSIRFQYRRHIRNSTDPFKRIVYCILGCCDINDEHSEVAKTADDYLWLKLNLVRDDDDTDEHINYSDLQSTIIEEYGEAHYEAHKQPHLYFQVLLLTGQFEAAIEFLARTERYRVHAVHFAIAINELHMLGEPRSVDAPLIAVDPEDPPPSRRLNIARLIMLYVKKFEISNPLEALHYYFMLRHLFTIDNKNLFMVCVSDLAQETRAYEHLFGKILPNGLRSLGIVDQFVNTNMCTESLCELIARELNKKGLYEDAIKMFDLAENQEEVLSLLSVLLAQVVNQPSKPGSQRERLQSLAQDINARYASNGFKCPANIVSTFNILRDQMKFFDLFHSHQYSLAMETLQKVRLLPLSMSEVGEKVTAFKRLSPEICKVIPDMLLAAMTILYEQYSHLKNSSGSLSKIDDSTFLKQLSFIREQAKALTNFAGTVPYRMPGDTNSRLVQMEILMH